jgi:hypothetical protein
MDRFETHFVCGGGAAYVTLQMKPYKNLHASEGKVSQDKSLGSVGNCVRSALVQLHGQVHKTILFVKTSSHTTFPERTAFRAPKLS